MNLWIKSMTSLVLFSALCISIHAQKGYVIDKNGKKMVYDSITSDAKGVLTVKKGRVGRKMNPRDYKFARVDMPSDVRKAYDELKNKNYAKAASLFKKLFPSYKYLGWDIFCIYAGAQAYDAQKADRDTISLLENLGDFPIDPAKITYYERGMKLLAKLYAESGNETKTTNILKILAKSSDDSIAPFCNNLRGDLLMKQGKSKDAKLMYMRTALLYDKTNKKERPDALKKIIDILKKEKNNKALEFEKMLNKDYP